MSNWPLGFPSTAMVPIFQHCSHSVSLRKTLSSQPHASIGVVIATACIGYVLYRAFIPTNWSQVYICQKPKKWRGVGAWEKNGWEVYGRQEKREWEVGFSTWGEVGEIGKIMQQCTIFSNQNSAKREEPTEIGWEPGLEGMGSGKLKPPVFPSPPPPTPPQPPQSHL